MNRLYILAAGLCLGMTPMTALPVNAAGSQSVQQTYRA